MFTIYALRDPRDGFVRYIGVTNNPRRRLAGHRNTPSCDRAPRAKWIRKLRRQRLQPEMVVLSTTDNELVASGLECAWIDKFQRRRERDGSFPKLLNVDGPGMYRIRHSELSYLDAHAIVWRAAKSIASMPIPEGM